MAILNDIYNLVSCGAAAVLGTNTKGCKQFIKKATSLWVTPQGFEFDGTEDFDSAYIQEVKVDGNLIVLKGVETFTDNSSENIIETLSNGLKRVITLGLYEFACTFLNGMAFNAALASLSSYGNYDVLFIDRDGNILGTRAASGNLKGFTVGMLQQDTLTFPTDTTGQQEGVMFQLIDRKEFDSDYFFVSANELDGYRPEREEGIYQVDLAFNTNPADTDTTIVIKAILKQNGEAFTGAVTTDFLVKRNGVTESQTVAESNGVYTFTVAALSTNDVISVELYDTVNSKGVLVKDLDTFKSNTVSKTTI